MINFILLIDRLFSTVGRRYKKYIFRKMISCSHKDFSLVGRVTLINNNIVLGHNVTIYPNVMFHGDGPIEIGDNVSIGNNTIIYSSKKNGGVKIGANTMIAANCYIIDCDHGISLSDLIRNQTNSVRPIVIGKDCWLATDVTVLKGSIIHTGAVIGAKALINSEIPENAVAVGIPAKVIKYRH